MNLNQDQIDRLTIAAVALMEHRNILCRLGRDELNEHKRTVKELCPTAYWVQHNDGAWKLVCLTGATDKISLKE